MELVWFAIVSVMLAVYTVLDGFDFGVGVLHRFVARNDSERRQVLSAIGPVWDGNEVWLIAAGGVLFMAFPKAYAASFSGFYMPLMIVLWLIILRGISMELRSHNDNALWREFWDSTLTFASVLLALVLGTALGNVIRGVPLDDSGFFAVPLFTDFLTGPRPGVFDWYTLLVGLFALVLLTAHGALYLMWKTDGPVQERASLAGWWAWRVVVPMWLVVTLATWRVAPILFDSLFARPWTLVLVVGIVGCLVGVFVFTQRKRELQAFLCSSGFILLLLAATMAGQFPDLLRSSLDPKYNVTATNAATSAYGLRVAMVWWSIGIVLVLGYFTFLFYSFRGKVQVSEDGHGY